MKPSVLARSATLAFGLSFLTTAPIPTLGTFGLIPQALAAQDVTFENVSTTFEGGSLTIPHIEISGSSLSKAELQALTEGPWGLSTADALSKFDAASITIPEIRLEFTAHVPGNGAPLAQNLVYREVRVEDIKSGKAARVSLASGAFEVKGPVSVTVSAGKFSATDHDFATMVRIVYAAAQPGEQLKQISSGSSQENVHIAYPNGEEVNVGHVSTGAVKARPLATPLAELLPALKEARATDKTAALAAFAKLFSLVPDFYDAVAIDDASISDITIKLPNPSNTTASIHTEKIGGFANSRIGEWSINGLEVNSPDGHVKLGRGALLGIDLKPFLSAFAAITKSGELNEEAMKKLDWRDAVPHLDSVEASGLDVDIRQGSSPQTFKIASYELKLGNYVGAIPTSLRFGLDNLVTDPSLWKGQGAELQQLGYNSVDVSAGTDVVWNESSKSLSVNEVSAKGTDMGSLLLKAILGNVPRELFAGSPAQMQVAGLGITLGEASLRIENTGLLDKIVARVAAAQKTTPDKLRASWGTQAALGIPQLLGGSDSAKAVGNAVASFIAKPRNLTLSVRAKDANGLGITDVISGGGPNPTAIFEKLDVKAVANQ
jgi:hypothetical protein